MPITGQSVQGGMTQADPASQGLEMGFRMGMGINQIAQDYKNYRLDVEKTKWQQTKDMIEILGKNIVGEELAAANAMRPYIESTMKNLWGLDEAQSKVFTDNMFKVTPDTFNSTSTMTQGQLFGHFGVTERGVKPIGGVVGTTPTTTVGTTGAETGLIPDPTTGVRVEKTTGTTPTGGTDFSTIQTGELGGQSETLEPGTEATTTTTESVIGTKTKTSSRGMTPEERRSLISEYQGLISEALRGGMRREEALSYAREKLVAKYPTMDLDTGQVKEPLSTSPWTATATTRTEGGKGVWGYNRNGEKVQAGALSIEDDGGVDGLFWRGSENIGQTMTIYGGIESAFASINGVSSRDEKNKITPEYRKYWKDVLRANQTELETLSGKKLSDINELEKAMDTHGKQIERIRLPYDPGTPEGTAKLKADDSTTKKLIKKENELVPLSEKEESLSDKELVKVSSYSQYLRAVSMGKTPDPDWYKEGYSTDPNSPYVKRKIREAKTEARENRTIGVGE